MLGSVDRLHDLKTEEWRALGERLKQIGLTATASAPYDKLAAFALNPLRAPMAKWHLRHLREPVGYAMRMLSFWDPVTPDEAAAALGPTHSVDRLIDVGLLARTPEGRVVSEFVLQVIGATYVLTDDIRAGGEAVMGVSPTTRGFSAMIRPAGRAHRALDVGCGAGALALTLAADCDKVVATDISPRAIALARANVALNGLTNIECRLGDLFDTVEEETFDLIASQPPFIASDPDTVDPTSIFAGPRGDEISVRLLRGVGPHLAPGGTAVFFSEWPVVEGDDPLRDRVREAVGGMNALSVLLLVSSDSDIDSNCVRYAGVGRAMDTAEFEEAAMRRRDLIEKMKIRALKPTLLFVRRRAAGAAWTSLVQSRDFESMQMSRERVFARIDANDLATDGPEAVAPARLRVPRGVRLIPDGDGVNVALDARQFGQPMRIDIATASILKAVHESDSVRTAMERLAVARGTPPPSFAANVMEVVRQALTRGLLEKDSEGASAALR